MDALIKRGQPLSGDVRLFVRRFREWTLTASGRLGQARDDNAQRSVTADEAKDRQSGTMIRPSTHERVILACRNEDWPGAADSSFTYRR